MKYLFFVTVLFALIVQPSVYAQDKWQTSKASNFIVYYKNVSEDFIQTVLTEAEDGFRNVSGNLGITRYQSWSWNKRASIYVYDDMNDYVQNGGQAAWSHGAALVQSKIINTYPADSGFFDSILPHELGHIILHEFVGAGAVLPLWFDEGVAMNQEKAKRVGAHAVVKKAIENGQFIPLTALTDMRLYKDSDPAKVELFYAESASIVNYMITQLGERHFFKFCEELKRLTPFEMSLPKVYMSIKNLSDLNRKWKAFLEE